MGFIIPPSSLGSKIPLSGDVTISTIIIPYKPRPIWKEVIHKELDAHRFAVIVAHRRFGKTVGMVNQIIKSALGSKRESPKYAYIAPFRNQAKMIAWAYLKYYSSPVEDRKVNEAELYVEFPSKHKNREGARIYIIGADRPDALRGTYWDGVVLDEYAQIRSELWGEVLRPALMDREGFAYFIGTPKGQNQFHEIYQRAVRDGEWYTCKYTVDDSNVVPPGEILSMKKDMTDSEIRQELYCDFSASSSNVVITIDMITESVQRKLHDVGDSPVVLGVDVARFGGDRSVIFKRQGLYLDRPMIYKNLDTMDMASRVAMAIDDTGAEVTFIDAGAMGAGVIDRLRTLGYRKIIEVPFASKATDDKRYANIRAEMYFKGKEWILSGGVIPDVPELKSELAATEYKFARDGRIILESKEIISEKLGRSPDLADAMMLTFARPINKTALVARKKKKGGKAREYNPLKRM